MKLPQLGLSGFRGDLRDIGHICRQRRDRPVELSEGDRSQQGHARTLLRPRLIRRSRSASTSATLSRMPVDVSVIVPFFNPGANIEDCIASLLAQTLSRDRFDVVLVDDGSTDGSGARVQEWVSRCPDLFSTHRIAASGGPGRPRNVGIANSAGRYLQFLDSDDTLAPHALERMLDIADSSDADVVVGKLSSDFRGIHHPMFRETVTHRTMDNFPLMLNLTVCKMFRREFLTAHNVRFPDGPHYIEDQHICIESYAHATSVAVVGDTACYFYRRRRTGGRNFGDAAIVPATYYGELAAIIDVIDNQIASPSTQLAVKGRFYRNEMLGRLRGHAMLSYDPAYRRALLAQVRGLATTRFPPELHPGLPMFYRPQSRLLLDNDSDGLVEFARQLEMIRLRATTTTPMWRDGKLILGVDAELKHGDEPLRLDRDGEGWALPAWMAPSVGLADRRLGANETADLDLATFSRADAQLWSTTKGLALRIDDDGVPRIEGEVSLDPSTLRGGAALTTGVWNLRLRVIIGGVPRTSSLRPANDTPTPALAWLANPQDEPASVEAFWTGPSPVLTLDVNEWSRSLHDLVIEQPGIPPQVGIDRRLTIAAPGLHGPGSDRWPAALILAPLDEPELGAVSCKATVRTGAAGSVIEATVPDLPATSARWSVWLRIGEIGGAAPRRLNVDLEATEAGELHLTASRAKAVPPAEPTATGG
jgi:glycosyltransferase involved in cell wall biosynthesis